jgi:transposase
MTKVSEIVKEYRVSYTSVYRWIQKYGTMKKKPPRLIVESESDTKKLLELKKRVAELERLVGQKQILIDFKDKMIELAEEHYNIDIKKNFSTLSSSDAGKKGKS